MMMNMEHRHGTHETSYTKSIGSLDGAHSKNWHKPCQWAVNTCYVYPGLSNTSDQTKFTTNLPKHCNWNKPNNPLLIYAKSPCPLKSKGFFMRFYCMDASFVFINFGRNKLYVTLSQKPTGCSSARF